MIKEFQGEFRWLSNFTQVAIELDGRMFYSVEHAYMSAKSDDEEWKDFCENTFSAGQVKKASRNITLVGNWEDIKVDIMKECIDKKFNQPFFKAKLLATGDSFIQEGNMWNDKFWGVCLKTGKGKNILGKLIMDKRESLKGKKQ
jgi:ribA/ribD-fused uncharacterized protein